MRLLEKLHVRVFRLYPFYPPLDVFQPLDEVHEHADDALEARSHEVKRYDGVLSERTEKNSLVRLFANEADDACSMGYLTHKLTRREPLCCTNVAVTLISATSLRFALNDFACFLVAFCNKSEIARTVRIRTYARYAVNLLLQA